MEDPEAADLDYLLSVGRGGSDGAAVPATAPGAVPVVPAAAVPAMPAAAVPAMPAAAVPAMPAAAVPDPATAVTTPSGGDEADGDEGEGSGGGASSANPRKRPLEDKEVRIQTRKLRNRELARVSNERRKGRIKAMENELTETRQTVSTLEESIRCLEAENKELRNLLQGKPVEGGAPQPQGGQ